MISIIVISHDRWPLTKLAVESALSQTGEREIIVVDDSVDKRIKTYFEELESAKVIRLIKAGPFSDEFRAEHKMISVMVNIGLNAARGDIIAYLCDDNRYIGRNRCAALAEKLKTGDVIVDRALWVTHDGRRLSQEWIGNYMYQYPLEKEHEGLVSQLRPSGCNFIVHDCAMHLATSRRWPEIENHTPVDWRFWLSLYEDGWHFETMRDQGVEAFVPGMWRTGVTDPISAYVMLTGRSFENGGSEVEKILYARNVSGKRQICARTGRKFEKNERVPVEQVLTAAGYLMPGFVYDDCVNVPDVDIDDMPKIEEPIVDMEDEDNGD